MKESAVEAEHSEHSERLGSCARLQFAFIGFVHLKEQSTVITPVPETEIQIKQPLCIPGSESYGLCGVVQVMHVTLTVPWDLSFPFSKEV